MSSLRCPLEHNITLTAIRLSDATALVRSGQDSPLEEGHECSKEYEYIVPELGSKP